MGYRSTVAYSIRFIPTPDKENGLITPSAETVERCRGTFFTFLAEAKANEDTALCFSQDESDNVKIDEENLSIHFFADGVKWYEDYVDVKCHEALMDLSREWADDGDCSNPYIGGAMARIGESSDDCVENCWGQGDYDWCCVRRFVECDWLN